jgi:hypothetical protein
VSLQSDNIEEWLAPAGAPKSLLEPILSDRKPVYYEHRKANLTALHTLLALMLDANKQISDARAILQALTQGVDPETGAELPQHAIAFRSDILRALYSGIAALDQVHERAEPRPFNQALT